MLSCSDEPFPARTQTAIMARGTLGLQRALKRVESDFICEGTYVCVYIYMYIYHISLSLSLSLSLPASLSLSEPSASVVSQTRFRYYVFIILAFTFGAILQRVCEHNFPNRGGSIVAVPLAAIVLIVETVQFFTAPHFETGPSIVVLLSTFPFPMRSTNLKQGVCSPNRAQGP